MRAFDKLFLLTLLNVLHIPALFVHYGIKIPANAMTLGWVLVLMTLRLILMSGARTGGLSGPFFSSRNISLFAYALLLLIAGLRAVTHEATSSFNALLTVGYLFCVLMIGVNYFGLRAQPLTWAERIRFFASGFVLFAVFNAVLFLIDMLTGHRAPDSIDGGKNLILAALGYDFERAKFPMAYGINAYGNVVAVALAFSLYLYSASERAPIRKLLHAAGILVCAISLILVESRGSIGSMILTLVWVFWGMAKADKLLIFSAPFSPLLLYGLVGALAAVPFIGALVRGDGTLSFGSIVTDRDIIWLVAINDLLQFEWIDVFGSGLFGNVTNGMLSQYSFMFSDAGQTFRTLHSFGLQTVIDMGYLGLFIALLVGGGAAGRVAVAGENLRERRLIRTVLLFLFLTGGVEATPTVYQMESFLAYIFVITAAYAYRGEVFPQKSQRSSR
jgi:hypothetical protein